MRVHVRRQAPEKAITRRKQLFITKAAHPCTQVEHNISSLCTRTKDTHVCACVCAREKEKREKEREKERMCGPNNKHRPQLCVQAESNTDAAGLPGPNFRAHPSHNPGQGGKQNLHHQHAGIHHLTGARSSAASLAAHCFVVEDHLYYRGSLRPAQTFGSGAERKCAREHVESVCVYKPGSS